MLLGSAARMPPGELHRLSNDPDDPGVAVQDANEIVLKAGLKLYVVTDGRAEGAHRHVLRPTA